MFSKSEMQHFMVALALLTTSCSLIAESGLDNARVPLDRLLHLKEGKAWSPLPPTVSDGTRLGIARDQLSLYIAGVVDSGEGERWCIKKSGLPPHEVDTMLLSDLQDKVNVKPAHATENTNSAKLFGQKLESEFPCF